MNRSKAEKFKNEFIELLYKYNISFQQFFLLIKDEDVVKYLAGLEKKKEEFYNYCKKVGFIV
ncbi:unnamed protein product [marine sediment metagenome]|uniref:Uncharacterized protein n=1 Tax=marine sediment metagenome TaxID=412755 RepID=X1KJS5_9ZZZZ